MYGAWWHIGFDAFRLEGAGIDLLKILGGQTKILGGQKVVISNKCMGDSQLLGARARDAPSQSLRRRVVGSNPALAAT